MQFPLNKKIATAIIIIVALCVGIFVFITLQNKKAPTTPAKITEEINTVSKRTAIGTSVEGRNIDAYTYGTGKTHIVFIGGMHGGYEWNSVLLAYKFIDYIEVNPKIIPENLTVTVIPSANPDGVYKVVGKEGRFSATNLPPKEDTAVGRFNANKVDLNRNFDCNWKPKSTWQNKVVSAGTKAFSEPEAVAIRDFVMKNKPVAGIFWHSQANAVYASDCDNGILPQTLDIMNAYSKASGYGAVKSFDAYPISGDAEGWMASINIPAITVELQTHETIEWDRNLAGIKALFDYYSKE
ncbi:MAG: hypothetical protein HQ402_02075 [Parcubacteria group bacterium]|nr:hypothetical protein [Parcubacteria group bacterium]